MVNEELLTSFTVRDKVGISHLVKAFVVGPAIAWSASSYFCFFDDRFIMVKLGLR